MRRTPPPGKSIPARVDDAEPVLQELEGAIDRAQQTLEDQYAQEADLRDRLYELRRANEAAEPFWLILEISRTKAFVGAVKEAKDRLLARARALSPQITTWEKAIDPTWKVSEISTRSGKKKTRPYQPPLPLLKVLQGAATGAPAEQADQEEEPRVPERGLSTTSRESRSALRVPVEPPRAENLASRQQPPVGASP